MQIRRMDGNELELKRDFETRIRAQFRLARRRKRYSYGLLRSDESDLGKAANRLYYQVMRKDDLRMQRKRIDLVLGKLPREDRRFIACIVKKRLSLPQTAQRFRLEWWEAASRLDSAIEKIQAMNLAPEPQYVGYTFGVLNSGCTMRKNLLRSDSR